MCSELKGFNMLDAELEALRNLWVMRGAFVLKLFRTIVNVTVKQPGGLSFEPCVMCMWFYT
jgi:hypothetical protein